MPRHKSRGGRKGKGYGGSGGGNGRETARVSYAEVVKQNEAFEGYYNDLDIVPEGAEREAFWAALRRELPASFRFCGSKGHALAVRKKLTDYFIPRITSMQFDGNPVEPPREITWYPNELAYAMTTPKTVIRKFPPFAAFQKFLVSETAVGNISRQEAVSMIPPLLMKVEPHHTVLDLCAAPGSKSAQIIEMLHAGEEARIRKAVENQHVEGKDTVEDDGRSTGLLIANDVNYSRAQMLVHQVKRLNSPNLIITNHDATLFPSIELPADTQVNGKPRSKWLKFDRVLADVPCSGDGTCRKNPNVWKDWIPGNGLGLYTTQVRILVRALQLLKVGGRVVYSTCSMNPIENEAVVASALERCGGNDNVEIIDCSNELPLLKRAKGLFSWKVMDKENRTWSSWEEVEDAKSKKFEASLERLVPGMFPPTTSTFPLDRCMRVYPHQQDTGGFFITVLEKKTEIKAKPEAKAKNTNAAPSVVSIAKEIESKPAEDGAAPALETLKEYAPSAADHTLDNGNASAAQRQNKEAIPDPPAVASAKRPHDDEPGDSANAAVKRSRTEKDDVTGSGAIGEVGQMEHWPPPPSAPLRQDQIAAVPTAAPEGKRRANQPHEESFKYLAADLPELDDIYSFYNISSRFPRDRFMVRNAAGTPAKAMYYTTALAKDILTTNEGRGMKFVHCGVKMFVRQEAQGQDVCRWRVQSEGLPIVEGWFGEDRVVRLRDREVLRKLLIEMFPRVGGEAWKALGVIGETVRDISQGCCVVRVEPTEGDDFTEPMTIPLWRSISSVNLMLPKEERKAMLLRLFNDESPLVDHNNPPRRAATTTAADSDGPDAGDAADGQDAAADADADGIMAEDRVQADAQIVADGAQDDVAAPERVGESDEMNTTV